MKTYEKIKNFIVFIYIQFIYLNTNASNNEVSKVCKKYSKYVFTIKTIHQAKVILYFVSYDKAINKYYIELDGIVTILDKLQFGNYILIYNITRK